MQATLYPAGAKGQEFPTLNAALKQAWQDRVTGHIVVDGERITLKHGKRPGLKPGTWVPVVNV